MPSAEALNGGLEILRTVDLRQALVGLPMPFLRLYGRLDGLVPRKIVPLLDKLWPESESILFDKAAHAPFVSHPAAFCEPLMALKNGWVIFCRAMVKGPFTAILRLLRWLIISFRHRDLQ